MWENSVKARLLDGEVQIGTWIHSLHTPELPAILAAAGFEFVNIDMEHGAATTQVTAQLCATALRCGIPAFVRPPLDDFSTATRVLDNGALGIYLPHVDDAASAEAAVRAIRFPPRGSRGSQPPSVTSNFGRADAGEYMPFYNEQVLLVVQVESAKALENVDEILGVDGIDGASVGRGDLAADLGLGGRRDHPDITAGVERVIAVCASHSKIPALMVPSAADARHWIGKGVRMILLSGEVHLLREAGAAAIADARNARNG